MVQVNIHEAKTRLSRLLAQVEAGEEVIIARGGHPIARLSAIKSLHAGRRLGIDSGLFAVPDDFNAPLPPSILAESER